MDHDLLSQDMQSAVRWGINRALIVLALLVLTFWLFFWFPVRAYVVEAETQAATIVFDRRAASAWSLSDPVVCRRQRGGGSATPDLEGYCSSELFEARRHVGPLELTWQPGVSIELRRRGRGAPLEILVLSGPDEAAAVHVGDVDLPANSLIFVDNTAWQATGSLVFSGAAVIGDVPDSGGDGILLKGSYEIREPLALRDAPAVVKTGSLFPGDRVEIVDAALRRPTPVFGFLAPSTSGDAGFRFQLFTTLGDTELAVDRLGAARSVIAANWSDRALRDPWLTGIVAVIGLFTTVFNVLTKLRPSLSA